MSASVTNLTVSPLALVFAALSALLAIAVPLGLAVACCVRRRGAWRAVLVGAACFFVAAMVLEQLLHLLVLRVLFPQLAAQHPALYALYGCLAAGLFEETARLVGLRWLCRRDAAAMTGFAYGVGHGGLEALLLGGLASLSNLANLALLQSGGAAALLTTLDGEAQTLAQTQLAALAATPPALFLAAGVERVLALAFHIALSVLIWMVVTRRLPAWGYAATVALHAGLDAFAMLYQLGAVRDVWLVEGCLAALTALTCLGVWRVWRRRGADL